MTDAPDEEAEAVARYEPAMRLRVSITGCLRNAAEELERLSKLRRRDEDDDDDEDEDVDWSGYYASSLREIAEHLGMLDADPALLFQFADLYALHGLAAAHVKADTQDGKA
jgi:hypothetical protein